MGGEGRYVASMKTIAQRWDKFAALVLPQNCHPMLTREMKRAFYAGFYIALVTGLEMADESKDSDDIGATMLQRLNDECQRFVADLQAGRA